MDLGAYSQTEDLDEIAKRNNIHVPRLRGYRLMKNEEDTVSKGTFRRILTGHRWYDVND